MTTDTQRMVTLKSNCTGTFVISEPAFHVLKEFPNKGSIQMLPYETVEQLLWQQGFKNAIDMGLIYIESMEDKIDLGLEEPETTTPTRIKVLSDADMITLFKNCSIVDFKKKISGVSVDQLIQLAHFAANNNLIDIEKADIIKDITGLDIVQMIAKKREFAEQEKIAAQKEKARRTEGEFNSI